MMKLIPMDTAGLTVLALAVCAGIAWMAVRTWQARTLVAILRAALDTSGAGVLVVDRRRRIVVFNRGYTEIWNIPELVMKSGRGRAALAVARDRVKNPDRLISQVEGFYADPEARNEETLEFTDGRMIHMRSEPLRLRGRAVGRIWNFVDVSRRARAEEALDRERLLLHTLVECLPDYIYAKDTGSRFLLVNTAGARMIGNQIPANMLGKTDRDFYPEELAARYMADERRLFESGQPLINREEPCVDFDTGAEKWLLTSKVPFRDGSGKVQGLVGLGRDVTASKVAAGQLRVAKEEAEAATRSKSEFLANMSHEIRTPMNGVLGMLELVLDTDLTQEQRECIETARASADLLLTVIDDILDFSKIEAGRIELDPIEFNLRDSLDDTTRGIAVRAHEKGLELVCEVSPDVPEIILADSGRLRQVVLNLAGNAIKFTERGEVTIQASVEETDGRHVVLHFVVADTGIGVPVGKQGSIFAAFTQADASTTRRYGGTGLGLSICSRLVALMGGRIWVESEQGCGSRFHFTMRCEVGRGAPEAFRLADASQLVGIPVLVVDDNATNRRVLDGLLTGWRMRPSSADSAEAAREALHQARERGTPFPLMISDVHMPDTDGFSLVEALRQSSDWGSLRIILLTSANRNGDAARCRALGVQAYLTKPVRRADLLTTLLTVFGDRVSSDGPKKIVPCAVLLENHRRLRVLLAEDNVVNQKVAARLIEKMGHTVEIAANGVEAISAIENGEFDLVFMDIQMPEMDGIEATERIRAKETATGKHQPIVAMTAHVMKGDKELCLNAGMDGYVTKPLSSAAIRDVLENIERNVPQTAG